MKTKLLILFLCLFGLFTCHQSAFHAWLVSPASPESSHDHHRLWHYIYLVAFLASIVAMIAVLIRNRQKRKG